MEGMAPLGQTVLQLQSGEHRDLLDTMERLKLQGVDKYIALPQIIVCGDQSAGKSSVLEAISGLSFPREEALCTRFPTELVLRRSTVEGIKITIVPGPSRSDDERKQLAAFSRTSSKIDIGGLVEEAKEAMGLSTKRSSPPTSSISKSGGRLSPTSLSLTSRVCSKPEARTSQKKTRAWSRPSSSST